MRVMICGDVHYSKTSSIIRGQGEKYSQRIENCIKSINWVEETAIKRNCDAVIFLGDFFDKPELDAQEITALNDIEWNSLSHLFLVGNHESNLADLKYSSASIFRLANRLTVINQPQSFDINGTELTILPYIKEQEKRNLSLYMDDRKNRIILSHNDILGMQYGMMRSQEGFEINDIHNHCRLFINGHIHNGSAVDDTIINIGNLTGQNFSEDAFTYSHNVMILDIDKYYYELIENPYAFNFYKLDIKNVTDLPKIKENAVLSIRTSLENLQAVKDIYANFITKYAIYESEAKEINTENLNASVDYVEKFIMFLKENIQKSDILDEEIGLILQ